MAELKCRRWDPDRHERFSKPDSTTAAGHEWHNDDHTAIKHKTSLDVITVTVCRWCYSVLSATSSIQQLMPTSTRQQDLQLTIGVTHVLDEARQLVRHELEVA